MKNIFPLLVLFFLSTSCKKEITSTGTDHCSLSEEGQLVLAELNATYAHPFEGADYDLEDPQLDNLLNYLATANFVGLGEATHGTADFYEMKHQLFKRLVEEHDFKAIIFEIPWGNCLKVNDFVVHGKGTADEAIDQTYYWTYDTKEVRTLAQWVHDYNLTQSEEEKVFFVGCDPQGGDFDIERELVADYLSKVQPDSAISLIENYNHLPQDNLSDYSNTSQEIKDRNIEGTRVVYEYLAANKEAFVAASSVLEYEIALMASHLIQHRELVYRTRDFGNLRDSLMAVYTEWWQRILGDHSKVAIWAHNFHVMDGSAINANYWMGTYLRSSQQDNYKNVAFSFSSGSFNAFLADAFGNFASPVQQQELTLETCGNVNYLLQQVHGDRHYLIFEELDGASKIYFQSKQAFLQLGAGFNENHLGNYTQQLPLARLFDVLIHFDHTTASILQ